MADRDLSPEEAQAMEAAVPRPLRSGEDGPRAKRAPLPESPPPAGARGARAGGESEPGRPMEPAASPEATAAFEALGDAMTPGPGAVPDGRQTAGRERPGETGGDDFTWEPPSQRPPGGGSPGR